MKKLFTITAVMLLLCSVTSAAVYYVDDQGNDANSGLSQSSPWKTISKVNSNTFQSGDQILFKRGGIWYETLTVKQNNLTFGAYGTGDMPVIDGQLTRTNNIYMTGRSGVTIQDIHLRNNAGSGSIRIQYSQNIVVQRCSVYATAKGIFIETSSGSVVRGNTITTPSYINTQTDGIYSQRNDGNIYEDNYIVISNTAETQHNDGIQCYLDANITARGNYIEQDNLKSGNAQGFYATNTSGRYFVYNNVIMTPNSMASAIGFLNLETTYTGTIEVYHNTVTTKGGNALYIMNAPSFIAWNNIFVSRGYTYAVTIKGEVSSPSNLNNNLYHNNEDTDAIVRLEAYGYNHNLAQLRVKGYELNGMYANPLLEANYTPSDLSPVVDKGVLVSATPLDKNGTSRPQGAASEFGAIERISEPVIVGLPSTPLDLSAVSNSTSAISLNWTDACDKESGFEIERFEEVWTKIATLTANSTSYSNTDLQQGTLYSYRVRAYNQEGYSSYSNTASATTDSVYIPPVVYDDINIEAQTGTLSYGSVLVTKSGSIASMVVSFKERKSQAEFTVNIPADGEWFISGRAFHSKGANSLSLQVNNGGKMNLSDSKVTGRWNWGSTLSMGVLTAGTYKLTVSTVKPGSESLLDMILISKSSTNNLSKEVVIENEQTAELRNYPNPFNPSTIISFHVPVTGHVEVSVFNSLGEKVADLVNEIREAGYFKVEWNASKLTTGIYFCRMQTGGTVSTQKMILMK
jgi:parallel beta-helix repeat protein